MDFMARILAVTPMALAARGPYNSATPVDESSR
jgi:hypothetical protein